MRHSHRQHAGCHQARFRWQRAQGYQGATIRRFGITITSTFSSITRSSSGHELGRVNGSRPRRVRFGPAIDPDRPWGTAMLTRAERTE